MATTLAYRVQYETAIYVILCERLNIAKIKTFAVKTTKKISGNEQTAVRTYIIQQYRIHVKPGAAKSVTSFHITRQKLLRVIN